MDSENNTNVNALSNNTSFSSKNIIIIILSALLILSFLGINFIQALGDFIQNIINLFSSILKPLLQNISFITGVAIGETSDIVADTSKTGVDIAHGTINSVSDLFIKAGGRSPENNNEIDTKINETSKKYNTIPEPDSTTNPIQKSISQNKAGWCLIDEYEGKRSCIKVSEIDKCMSGQVFPSQKLCINPTLTQN